MLCNWTDSKSLCDLWNKMSKGNYRWNDLQIVYEEPADWYVIINGHNIDHLPSDAKCIYIQMEPHLKAPADQRYKHILTWDRTHNMTEWHLAKTYYQLRNMTVSKSYSILSAILSDKYNDPGHIKRIDFVKYLESKGLDVHVYGGNRFKWKNYKGALPSHQKDDGLFPYKYTINVENHETRGYFSEKLVDGILAECLVFYNGCINIKDYFDERALVKLDLIDFESDFRKIASAIENNLWEERLPYIRVAKEKILNEYQFFPRIEKLIAE